MAQLNIYVSDKQKEALRIMSIQKNRSVSYLVRVGIEKVISKDEKKKEK